MRRLNMSGPDYERRLRAKLDGSQVRLNLARVGLVLATHEFVKGQIIDQVRSFFVILNTGQDRYQKHVLGKAPGSAFLASCLWLQDMGALDHGDYETLHALQRHRHAVAHELVTYVADPHSEVDVDLVRSVAEIIRRLGVFWARISMDADEMYDGVEVADEDIQSGPSIFVDFLLAAVDEVAQP
jgi:hypothetical protein